MKKTNLLLYVLVSLFLVSLSIGEVKASNYINYYGININDEEYDNLINLGFSENEIYYMTEETFEENKNVESELVVENVKYYKSIYTDLNGESYSVEITKNEYETESSISTLGTVETEYKSMVSTMSKGTDSFRYKVSLSWKNMPAVRNYDIVGVGFEGDVYIYSGVYFSYTYCDEDDNCTTSSAYYDKKELSTGGSAVYKVPNGDIRALSVVLYYDVKKNISDTITELHMCGDYSHATSAVSGTNYTNHTVHIGGLQLYSSIYNNYDAIPCAESIWYGSW